MIKIEKGIPLTNPVHPGGQRKYPFGEMELGDSFYWDGKRHRVDSAASYYGKRNNKKFAVRKEGSGARCWRTE